ncbi:LEM domain-containing protein 1 [Cricetulus griseus]|uniref:LEM domain-containing protein 1 n=1 Tax=Cricetulus griseus TaxID=10029 RepID=G3HAX9_CRIGR|nr:LEM domain-containing protein 1 [Cricetulus griseus]
MKRLKKLHEFEDSDESEGEAGGKSHGKSRDWVFNTLQVWSPASPGEELLLFEGKSGERYAARSIPRVSHGCATKEDYCGENQSLESSFLIQNLGNSFPWGLKLAILGIFIIVVFVYITVEKKPLLP